MSEVFTITQCLSNTVKEGTLVTVQGWVKTRRDSKAGLSFISLHDGSCFDPIQIVATDRITNYQEDVLRLTAGCAIRVLGQLVDTNGRTGVFASFTQHRMQ